MLSSNVSVLFIVQEIVDESHCFSEDRPATEEFCVVPCAYDCVVSSWSEWSRCSKQCTDMNSAGVRMRNRSVIAPPGPGLSTLLTCISIEHLKGMLS